ncbi:MAG: DinB family protein [Holophagaceae bacterium]|nr:DinB family protein [Holophagaceae bacterium]
MPLSMIALPQPDEYASSYAGYIAKVPELNVLEALESNLDELALLGSVPDHQAGHRYAPDKWSIREVAGHLIDAERVFAYRALRFSRKDATNLPGFDENEFVAASAHDRCRLEDLLEEFRLTRQSNLWMFRGMTPEMLEIRGTANGHAMSVRAAAAVMAGHLRHHVGVLKERYL